MTGTINGRPMTPAEEDECRRRCAAQEYFYTRVAEIVDQQIGDRVLDLDDEDGLSRYIRATIEAMPVVRAEMNDLAQMAHDRKEC